jgi:hypothetical protein
MTTPNSSSRRSRSKNDENAVSNHSRECALCNYALHPNTLRCSNGECPRHARESGGAMTAAQILHEFAPPSLFHGRRWGSWILDVERLCLVYDGKSVHRGEGSGVTRGVGAYVAFLGKYEIDLESISRSSGMLDWIFQINGKTWSTARVTKDLLNAFDDVFHPQRNLCSGGLSGSSTQTIENTAGFLRARIASVGKTDGPPKDAA